jgi:hypothetical protein
MALRITFDSCMEGSAGDIENFNDAMLVARALSDRADVLREEARDLLARVGPGRQASTYRAWGRTKLEQARRLDELVIRAAAWTDD